LHPGFGFVEFEKVSEAEAAMKEMNESEIDGRNIRLDFARPKGERSEGGFRGGRGGGRGGFRGGRGGGFGGGRGGRGGFGGRGGGRGGFRGGRGGRGGFRRDDD